MVELDNGFKCNYPDCFNCDHEDCDAPDQSIKAEAWTHKKWTDKEIQYLYEHELYSIESLAKALNRSPGSVKCRINTETEIKEKRQQKRQEWILEYIQKKKASTIVEIALMMGVPKGVISHDCRLLAQKHEEIKRKNGKIKWVECV